MHRSPRARRIGIAAGIALFVLLSISFGVYHVASNITAEFSDGSLSDEELAQRNLTEYRDDVEFIIQDLTALKESEGFTSIDFSWNAPLFLGLPSAIEIDVSYPDARDQVPDSMDTKRYTRMLKPFQRIDYRSDGTIIFSSRGFLRGYTGFYYSPDGLEKDVSDSADWYHTYNLEPNYYYFEFGY